MAERKKVCVVMSSEVEEERIRGITYSQDTSRLRLRDNGVAFFQGDHGSHVLARDKNGKWSCSCRASRRLQQLTECRHAIALERILERSAIFVQSVPLAAQATLCLTKSSIQNWR